MKRDGLGWMFWFERKGQPQDPLSQTENGAPSVFFNFMSSFCDSLVLKFSLRATRQVVQDAPPKQKSRKRPVCPRFPSVPDFPGGSFILGIFTMGHPPATTLHDGKPFPLLQLSGRPQLRWPEETKPVASGGNKRAALQILSSAQP